jgi:hypothetical protein
MCVWGRSKGREKQQVRYSSVIERKRGKERESDRDCQLSDREEERESDRDCQLSDREEERERRKERRETVSSVIERGKGKRQRQSAQ